ncbi:MAG: RNA polymerase sigma factor [Thermoleophilaceae bacterium]
MSVVGMDLLPRDAELARRAAGGDGAAFVRLYDHYSTEVFATALEATGSVEAAADATQMAFLRVLRWPPPLGAPDGDVHELLCALALGGSSERVTARADTDDARNVARLVGVGWLRSETVAKAGAKFDEDWSAHLWTAPPAEPEAEPEPEPQREEALARPRRWRRLLPRLSLPVPSPTAAGAVLVLLLFAGAAGTIAAGGGPAPTEANRAEPAADAGGREASRARRAEERRSQASRLLRNQTVQPLVAP